MVLKDITDALTLFFNKKYPDVKGFFIGKESIEPTRINAYKAYKIEIYWHVPGENHLVFTQQEIGEYAGKNNEQFKKMFLTVLLEQIFTNLNKIENEIIQNGWV